MSGSVARDGDSALIFHSTETCVPIRPPAGPRCNSLLLWRSGGYCGSTALEISPAGQCTVRSAIGSLFSRASADLSS